MYDVSIDDRVNYTKGEDIPVNCSSRSGSEYTVSVVVHFQNDTQEVFPNATEFRTYSDCSVDLYWTFLIPAFPTFDTITMVQIECKIEDFRYKLTKDATKMISVY